MSTTAAFFDLDKTVIDRASMVAFGGPLYKEGLISRWLLLRALYGQLVYLYLGADEARLARMKDSVLALTKGWEQDRVRRIVEETLTDVVEPIVYDEALELIAHHKRSGHKVFIVSASPEEIVAPLARYLGVDAHLATRSEIDDDGRYSGRMAFYCYGPEKAVAMRQVAADEDIDLAASYAYSDSATDLPMLEAVGHPVAVNPDRELLRAAKEHDWEVLDFTHKVRLRDRMPHPAPKQSAAVGGGLAAAAAAGAGAWWWMRRRADAGAPQPLGTWDGLRRRGAALASDVVTRRGPSWRRTPQARRGWPATAASSWRRA
jgi:HAD superfamily hydrolase (TIGR01490 family)